MVASIFSRLRMMPSSAIRRATSFSVKRAIFFGIEPMKGTAEVLALSEDGDPRQAGLKTVEHQLLEHAAERRSCGTPHSVS